MYASFHSHLYSEKKIALFFDESFFFLVFDLISAFLRMFNVISYAFHSNSFDLNIARLYYSYHSQKWLLFEHWIVVFWKISPTTATVWAYKLSNARQRRKTSFSTIDSVILLHLNHSELAKTGYSLYFIWSLKAYLNHVSGTFCLNRNGSVIFIIFINSSSSKNN